MNYEQKYNKLVDAIKVLQEANPSDEGIQSWVNDNVPELAEPEDEGIRKTLIELVRCNERSGYFSFNNIETSSIIAWLEKQGEQKAANSSQACTMETLMTLDEAIEHCKEKSCDDTACGKEHKQLAEWLTELKGYRVQGTQNTEPVDKPKFHPGDWVINTDNRLIWEITNIRNSLYYIRDINGNEGYETYDGLQDNYRLWVITDATNGDVLAEDSCIFIIQKLEDNSTAAKTYWALYNDGGFDDGSILYFNVDSTKPATKEQRDLLFRKMEEAGYKFDKIKNDDKI